MTSPWSPGDGRQGHGATEQMAPGLDRWEPCRCLGEPSRPCGALIIHGEVTSRGWGPATCPPAAPLPAARRVGAPRCPVSAGQPRASSPSCSLAWRRGVCHTCHRDKGEIRPSSPARSR